MRPSRIFKTKSGYCHITKDRLILSRNEIIKTPDEVFGRDYHFFFLCLYAVLAAVMIYLSYRGYQMAEYYISGCFFVLASFLLIHMYASRNNSLTNVIIRSKITDIQFRKAVSPRKSAYFIIFFEDNDGNIKRRFIELPSVADGDETSIQRALDIMSEEFG